jgi:hypothetical protein
MGLAVTKQAVTWVKVKGGKFYLASDKELTTPYDELQGTIADIGYNVETFNGAETLKLNCTIESDGEKYRFSMPFEGSTTSTFLGFLKNVNLKEPLALKPTSEKIVNASGEERERQTILIQQDGTFMKQFYTKDNPNGLPPMKQVKINGKMIWDKTDMIDFFKDVIKNELRPSLNQTAVETVNPKPKEVSARTAETVTSFDDDSDSSLPF